MPMRLASCTSVAGIRRCRSYSTKASAIGVSGPSTQPAKATTSWKAEVTPMPSRRRERRREVSAESHGRERDRMYLDFWFVVRYQGSAKLDPCIGHRLVIGNAFTVQFKTPQLGWLTSFWRCEKLLSRQQRLTHHESPRWETSACSNIYFGSTMLVSTNLSDGLSI